MSKKIHIAQLVWPDISVPPKKYGSIQSIVKLLVDGLVDDGNMVTTFASGDSRIKGKLISVSKMATKDDPTVEDKMVYRYLTLSEIIKRRDEFDLIHSHLSYGTFPLLEVANKPVVLTLHCIYRNQHLIDAYQKYAQKAHFVTISNFQASTLPKINWAGTVYHSVDLHEYPFLEKSENYFLFAGRIMPEKGLEDAIRISQELDISLKVAGSVDSSVKGKNYFDKVIRPNLSPKVELLGELDQKKLKEVTSKAKAVICPFKWDETFGLVMIESMACGTPVIAYKRGSVSEIIQDKKTGYICPANDLRAMIESVSEIIQLDSESYSKMRRNCRKLVEEKFSVNKMVEGYENVYRSILDKR